MREKKISPGAEVGNQDNEWETNDNGWETNGNMW